MKTRNTHISFNESLLYKLNPNLDNIEIYQKFNDILNENIISFMNIPIINKNEHQTIINDMYLQLISSIKNAYDSCCRTCSYNNIIKKKKVFFSFFIFYTFFNNILLFKWFSFL